jgi:hypothetical protein
MSPKGTKGVPKEGLIIKQCYKESSNTRYTQAFEIEAPRTVCRQNHHQNQHKQVELDYLIPMMA